MLKAEPLVRVRAAWRGGLRFMLALMGAVLPFLGCESEQSFPGYPLVEISVTPDSLILAQGDTGVIDVRPGGYQMGVGAAPEGVTHLGADDQPCCGPGWQPDDDGRIRVAVSPGAPPDTATVTVWTMDTAGGRGTDTYFLRILAAEQSLQFGRSSSTP